MYYIYELIDPRSNLPFYVGKGTGRRASTHLWSIPETRNQYKENKIKSIRSAGIEPIIKYVIEDIQDENLAYQLEEELIMKYGRKGYDCGGILTNVCSSNHPPNHKGKSYIEIYGSQERASEEIEKRKKIQLDRGGFGPKEHSKETKDKISLSSTGLVNGNSSGISEDELMKEGQLFCDYFEYKISKKKWIKWCERQNMPPLLISFRFGRKYIIDVFAMHYNAKIVRDSMLWFHDPKTKKTWRCFDWELEFNFTQIPTHYIKGRGKGNCPWMEHCDL